MHDETVRDQERADYLEKIKFSQLHPQTTGNLTHGTEIAISTFPADQICTF